MNSRSHFLGLNKLFMNHKLLYNSTRRTFIAKCLHMSYRNLHFFSSLCAQPQIEFSHFVFCALNTQSKKRSFNFKKVLLVGIPSSWEELLRYKQDVCIQDAIHSSLNVRHCEELEELHAQNIFNSTRYPTICTNYGAPYPFLVAMSTATGFPFVDALLNIRLPHLDPGSSQFLPQICSNYARIH